MRHHILVKWKAGADKAALQREADALFRQALDIPGVHSVSLHPNVIDRPNRYDLLILMCMEPGALPVYDGSEMHRAWKERFGPEMETKAIFDCE